MALRLQSLLRSKAFKQLVINSNRSYAYWNKDWRPGSYPETDEERNTAAKRYGLRPKDYEPYPNDGWQGLGDYPKVPMISESARDPYENWDHPEEKRNFGEIMHPDADMMREAYWDPNQKYRISFSSMIVRILAMFTTFVTVGYISSHWTWFRPMMPKQYPNADEKHYTFESATGGHHDSHGHGHGHGHGHH